MTLDDRLAACEQVWPGTRASGSLACSRALVALDEVERGRVPEWLTKADVEALRLAWLEQMAEKEGTR